MSAQESAIKAIARRYAVALFELLQETPTLAQDEIAENIASLGRLIESSAELTSLLRSPIIARDAQAAALDKVLEKAGLHMLVRNFVQVVMRNRRGFTLFEITRQFAEIIAEARNEMTAYVRVAKPLKPAQAHALKGQLQEIIGKTIHIEAETDPTVLGGFIIRIGTRLVDASLAYKLQSLQHAMNEVG